MFARDDLSARWAEIETIAVDESLLSAAGDVAERYRLRALDALHLAAVNLIADEDTTFASWDEELRRAAIEAGLAVAPA